MSGQALWNPAWEPDISDFGDLTRDKTERLYMSGLWAGHVWVVGWTCPKNFTGTRIRPT
jgi:hypothetical protein